MKHKLALALGLAVAVVTPAAALAHFILHEPASWLVESRLGDPQKVFPCGGAPEGSATPHVLTNKIGQAVGGSTIHIKVQETIYHPGFYRVALAVQGLYELPADPEVKLRDGPRGPISVSGRVDPNPKPPVLADGLFMHHAAPAAGSFYETDIKLPNINCDHCTLQIVQFMEEHGPNKPGDYTYHHCAAVKITANPKLPIDKAWPGQVRR